MTETLSLIQKVNLALLRLLFSMLALVPIHLRSAFGLVCGILFSFIPTRDRKIARLQLQRFLEQKSTWRTLALIYGHLGQNIMEAINLTPILRNSSRYITQQGFEIGRRFHAEGKGIVTLTAHTGNWDLFAAYVIQEGFHLLTVGKEARNPVLQKLLSELRNKYKIETLWRANASVQRRMIRALKEKSVVAALIDQDTKVSGRMLPFFGVPAYTPTGLVEIAKRTNAGIVSAFLLRRGFMRFQVFVKPIDPQMKAEEIAAEYNKHLEALLREYPDQWVWFHKRWRTLPNGTRLSSKEYISKLEAGLADAI